VFLVPLILARTTLPKLPSPTSLITSYFFSRGCATPSWKPSEGGGIGVIVSKSTMKKNVGCQQRLRVILTLSTC
jgi:hypothetical protein